MFPPVFDAAGGPGPSFVEGVRRQLGGQRCPDDGLFLSALTTKPLYATAEKNARLRLILERIERSFGHKEAADLSRASIEHVLPQTLTDAWRSALGDDPDEEWERHVHTLGNLTLSAYNAELSNQPYEVKRTSLVDSHFDLNRDFKDVDRWTPDSIKARATRLAMQALRIWPDVGRPPSAVDREKRSSAAPTAVRFRDALQPCKTWKDGFQKLVKLFEDEKPGFLSRVADDESLFGVVSKDGERFRRSKIQIGDAFVNTHAGAAQLQDWCRKIAEFAGIAPADFEFILPPEST